MDLLTTILACSLVRRMMYATVLAILYYAAILVFIIIWMDFLTTILSVLV